MVGNLPIVRRRRGGDRRGRHLGGVVIRRRIIGWRRHNHIDGLVDRLWLVPIPRVNRLTHRDVRDGTASSARRGLVHVRNGVIHLDLAGAQIAVYRSAPRMDSRPEGTQSPRS